MVLNQRQHGAAVQHCGKIGAIPRGLVGAAHVGDVAVTVHVDHVLLAPTPADILVAGQRTIDRVYAPEAIALHRAGYAHSVEVWVNGELVGGLYCVALGKAVFGESMFSWQSNASKIALAALVSFCRFHHIRLIDCQQNTRHLASLGAAEMPRASFVAHVTASAPLPGPEWQFLPLYWAEILPPSTPGS